MRLAASLPLPQGVPSDARLRVARWLLVASALALFAAGQALVMSLAFERHLAVFRGTLRVYGTSALLWLAVAPLVVALARALPWPGRAHRLRAGAVVVAHALCALLVALAHAWWERFAWQAFTTRGFGQPLVLALLNRIDLYVFLYLAIVGAVYAADHWRRLLDASARAARLTGELVRARLHVLTMQLHPHFLFNTLHSISELAHRDPPAAGRTARQLRDLLRHSFSRAASAETTLGDELEFLQAYLGIQRTRFGDGLTWTFTADPDALDARVPCLVLQPLVENAIQHGFAPRGGHGHVRIEARRAGDVLEIRVRDDGVGLTGTRRERRGLGNTRARLAELHDDDQRLELRAASGGGTEAVVTLPFRAGSDAPPARGALEDVSPPAAELPSVAAGERLAASARPELVARRRGALLVLTVWSTCALFWILQTLAMHAVHGNEPHLGRVVSFNASNAALWAALSFLVAAGVRRLPVRREHIVRLAAIHGAIALAAAALMAVVRQAVYWQDRPLFNPALSGWFAWDVATYFTVAAFAHASVLASRRRARLAEVQALEGELSRAETDLLEWRLRPEFLVETLDDVADVSAHDAERADEMTARLGDLLRAMLQHTDGARVPLGREVEMAEAFLDVHRHRAPGRLTTRIDVDPALLEARVPGMLLLPLVEALLPPRIPSGAALRVSLEIARRRDALVVIARRDGGRTLAIELPLELPKPAPAPRERRLVPVGA